MFFARNAFAPETSAGRTLLGHELTHVVQQNRAGNQIFQCTPDPLVAGLTPTAVADFTAAELTSAEATLIEHLGSGAANETFVLGMEGNLALIQDALRSRDLPVTPHTGLRLTSDPSHRVDANQLLTLQTRFDLAIAMARSQLPGRSGALVQRLEADRDRLEYLHVDALEDTASKIGALVVGIAHLGQVARVLSGGRPSNQDVAVALDSLGTELNSAIPFLGTTSQDAAITKVDEASTEYTSAITRALISTAMILRDELNQIRTQENAVGEDRVAPLRSDNNFIGGYVRGNRIQFGESSSSFSAYTSEREAIEGEFAELGQLDAMADAPLEQRLAFLQGEGADLLDLVRRGQGLLILHSGIALGNALMHATTEATDAVQWGDIATAEDLVENVVRPLGTALEGGQVPSDAVIATAQRTLSRNADTVSERLVQVQTHLRRFGYFVQFSTMVLSLFTGMAAMRLATGGASLTQLTLGQFVRGSLAFTAGSYATNIALTDAEFNLGDLALQAGVDLATLGLMRFVGVGLAARYPRGAVPPAVMAGSQFATLWAWSTTLSVAGRLFDDSPDNDPSSLSDVLSIGGDSAVHTAEAFVALAIAHKLATVPTVTAESGESNAARVAIAEITRLAEVGRQIEADVQRWAQRGGESRGELEALMRRAEGWYGEYRRGLRGLVEADVLDAAAATHLGDAIAPDLAQIRNVSDAARLGLRQTGQLTTAYSGGTRNFDLYLSRLLRQNLINEYTPQGRTGVYEVRYPDGSRGYFYPEAREAGSGIPDFAAETLEAQFPNMPQAARARALENLGRLPPGEATRIIGELGGEHGRVVADFLGDPETTALIAREGSFITPEVIRGIARDAELRNLVETEGGRLQHWFDTTFEAVVGGRGSSNFVRLAGFIRQFRGTLEVGSAAEAQAIIDQLATTTEAFPFSPRTYRRGASMGRPGSAVPFDPYTWMAEHARGRTLGGAFHTVGSGSGTIFVQVLRGRPARAWRFANGETTPVEVDVGAHIRAIEQGLESAESMPDAGTRQATLDSLRFHADAVGFLRGIRGVNLAEVNALLERVSPRAPAPASELRAATEASPVETAELVPLTRGEATQTRRRSLLERAIRMGEVDDPVVSAIARWNPRVRSTVPADPAATLDAVEARLNRLADAATRRVRRRLRGEFEGLRTGAFEGRSDIGDILHLTNTLEGMTPKALRGLGYAAQQAPSGRPIAIERIFELTRNNAADRTLVLEAFADAVEFRHADGTPIEGVYRMLREMTHSRNNWRGGVWVFRDLVTAGGPGFADVAAFEAVETRTETVDGTERVLERRYDVRLRDGQHLEYKSWTRWFPSSIRSQFARDVRIQTADFSDMTRLERIHWRFERRPLLQEGRGADTRSREMTETEAFEAVRAEMLAGLQRAMTEAGISRPVERAAIEAEFHERVGQIIFIGGGQP